MISSKKNFSIDSVLLTNLIFAFFPISFVLGNLIINANVILFCGLGLFHLRSKILTTKFDLSIKIIFLLFFAIIFSTSLNFIKSLYFEGYEHATLTNLIKSVVFFRFFLMLLITYLLYEFDILKFKYFFLSAAFTSILIALDIIYQYFFGYNIAGIKSTTFYNSGFFGSEQIAGGFIQNFSFFSIMFMTFIFKNKNYTRFILITIVICILGVGILVSGNRMPFILYLFGLVLTFFFSDKLRIIIPSSLICIFVFLIFVSDAAIKNRYHSAYDHIVVGEIVPRLEILIPSGVISKFPTLQSFFKKNYEINKKAAKSLEIPSNAAAGRKFISQTGEKGLIFTAIDTWSRHKIFGNGMKSFRITCQINPQYILTETTDFSKKLRQCSNHPHNYYFEILTETGIIGLSIVLIIALFFVIFIFKNLKVFKGNNIEHFFILAAAITLILELFPLKTSGSVFTTNDAAYIVLISSIILSHKKILKAKNF